MNFETSHKVTSAVLLASSICLTITRAQAAVPPGAKFTAFSRQVQRHTGPGNGTIMTMFNSGGGFGSISFGEYLLGVPNNNAIGPFTGYAGVNLPPLTSGLTSWALSGQFYCGGSTAAMGHLTEFDLYYTCPNATGADPGLKLMMQDSATGHYHLTNSNVTSSPLGGSQFDFFSSTISNAFTPALPTGFGSYKANTNKAAIMFFGGKASKSNAIHLNGVIFDGVSSGFDTFYAGWNDFCSLSGYGILPVDLGEPGFDSHFNFEFNTLNTIS